MDILRNPNNGELVADFPQFGQVYLFDGTPIGRDGWIDTWVKVGEAPDMDAWQADPGRYTPAYIVTHIVTGKDDRVEIFVAGGSYLYVTAWCKDFNGRMGAYKHLYDDRNTVRKLAEEAGGVAW